VTRDHLGIDTLGALAEGSLDAESRARILPHLASCTECRSALASISRALADPDLAREIRATEVPAPRRWWRVALPVAAAALLLVLIRPAGLFRNDPVGQHRSPVLANGTAPSGMSPAGVVASAPRLVWRPVEGADHYRVTLFDAGGRMLYEVEPRDTVVALPDSLRITPGQRYLWRVEAQIGFDRWVASDLIEFTVARDGR
jgi:hypothetical protein